MGKIRRAFARAVALALLLALALPPPFPSAALAAEYETLEYGSRGADVLKLQQALMSLGYTSCGTDGKFGKGTERAVKLFQESVKLTADGKAGSKTLTKLYDKAGVSAGASGATNDSSSASGNSDSSSATFGTTATSSNPNTLKYGDSGARVTALQTALTKLGYNTNGVDGRFGAGTQRAVVSFQTAQGLTADGLAGTATLALLNKLADAAGSSSDNSSGSGGSSASPDASSGSAASDGSFTRTLRKGMTGADVKSVQTQLKTLGYYALSVDGVYGTGSIAAVKTFQQKNGLTADGLAGQRTFDKLFSSSALGAGSTESAGSTGNTDSDEGAGSSASSGVATYVTLSYGSKGDAVKALQKALKALDYNVGADGDYGALTQSAVTAFQKRNGLTADGVAGAKTQQVLYSGSAKKADASADDELIADGDTGKANGPSASSVKLLHWYNEVKPSIRAGQTVTIFDPATNLQWTLRLYSLGHHADSEPLTLTDTQIMYRAFGYTNTWTPKAVYVKLPSGTWTLATMHNVPHLSGSIKNNGFDGHLCVHFLRDMDECQKNDPNYGVTHQKAIRKKWLQMTGETVD